MSSFSVQEFLKYVTLLIAGKMKLGVSRLTYMCKNKLGSKHLNQSLVIHYYVTIRDTLIRSENAIEETIRMTLLEWVIDVIISSGDRKSGRRIRFRTNQCAAGDNHRPRPLASVK